jgi:hypothetical protein
MRIFLPASLAMLRAWVGERGAGPAPLTGYAVTSGLRAFYVDTDQDELEYAAMTRAARASLRLLSTEPRRVVVAVDVPDATVEVRDDLDEGVVRTTEPVPWRSFAAAFVDDEEAEGAVAQAIPVVDAADLGDSDAEFLVGETEAYELQWFAVQELADL